MLATDYEFSSKLAVECHLWWVMVSHSITFNLYVSVVIENQLIVCFCCQCDSCINGASHVKWGIHNKNKNLCTIKFKFKYLYLIKYRLILHEFNAT